MIGTDPGGGPGREWTAIGLPRAWPVPEADELCFDAVPASFGPTPPGVVPLVVAVTFDHRGVDLVGDPGAPGLVPWSEVRGVWLGLPFAPPSGGVVTPIDLVWVGGSARLLLPGDRVRSVRIAVLEDRLYWWSPPPPGAVPRLAPLPVPAPGPSAWVGPGVWYPPPFLPMSPRPTRTRRRRVLVAGVVLILAAAGLAVALSISGGKGGSGGGGGGTGRAGTAPSTPDQQLADRVMLTLADLPVGWRADRQPTSAGDSRRLRAGQQAITERLASCMGVTEAEAQVVLGGPSSDQTAESSSPIFVAPTSAVRPGFAMELQTAAAVVRSPQDAQTDLALLADPRYPACGATATAAELQLGLDIASGGHGQPGSVTGTVLALPAPDGERLSALAVSFTVADQAERVSVEVDSVSVGADRVEADLQAYAIGGTVPDDLLHSSVAALVERVATGGTSRQI